MIAKEAAQGKGFYDACLKSLGAHKLSADHAFKRAKTNGVQIAQNNRRTDPGNYRSPEGRHLCATFDLGSTLIEADCAKLPPGTFKNLR